MAMDPRAQRTRHRIFDAVLALSADGEGVLSVSAIARSARINRSSFYAHFDSIDQVAIELLDESLEMITELGWRARADSRSAGSQGNRDLLSLVEHVEAQRTIYTAVLVTSDSAAQAQSHVGRVLATKFEQAFRRYGATRVADDATVRAASIGVGAAMTAILVAWLRGDLECSRDRLAEYLESALPEWTRQLANPQQGENHE